MLANFKTDLVKGHRAEQIVKDVFTSLTDKYTFQDVSNNPSYYHKGDLLATAADGRQIYIEIKNDEVIYKTGNVLCEEEVYYKDVNYFKDGYMYSDYEIYCVVSEPERKIYVIDFKVLKSIYRKGEEKIINHYTQYSDVYLVPVGFIKQNGGLIDVIEY